MDATAAVLQGAADTHVLISTNSPIMDLVAERIARRREERLSSLALPAPTRAEPDVEPVPVVEQEAVLDLSSGRRNRHQRSIGVDISGNRNASIQRGEEDEDEDR
jgi:hypothetical protein